MSYSSLFSINKGGFGEEILKFGNGWLFSPIAWDVLLEKYMSNEIQTPYGYKKGIIGPGGAELSNKLNTIVNGCDELCDRLVWEMSNQQIFFAKDKKVVADCIRGFVKENARFSRDSGGDLLLEAEHIQKRWAEIASSIERLEEDCEYFVFKNTSVDDGVEQWFRKYDEESGEYIPSSISEMDEFAAEFVVINHDKTIEFVTNLEFFKNGESEGN